MPTIASQLTTSLLRQLLVILGLVVICHHTASASDKQIPEPDQVLRRYIPADRLNAVMQHDKQGALLPAAEFETLLQKAHAAQAPKGAPSGATILDVKYAGRLEAGHLLATCRLTVRSFSEGWQTLNLPVGGWSIRSAREVDSDTAPALTRNADQADQLTLLIATPGTKTYELELSAPMSAAGGDSAVTFEVLPAPAGSFHLEVPAQKRLRADGLDLPRPAPDDQPAQYVLGIGGQSRLSLLVTDRKSIDRTDSMTFASTAIGVVATPGESTWTARCQLNVFGRSLDRLVCDVPSHLEITAVESTGLEAWELSDGEAGRTQLTLTWRQPFDGSREIAIKGLFSPNDKGHWLVPNLILKDVSSQSGSLTLERPADVRLQILTANGVRQSVSNGDAASSRLQFELWQSDFTLEFLPAAREREVRAALSTLLNVHEQGLTLVANIDLETRFADLFEADVVIPAAWQPVSAVLAGQPVEWQVVPQAAGRTMLRIAFTPPLKPGEQRPLTLTARFEPENWPANTAPQRIIMPDVRLPQASAIEAFYGLAGDASLQLNPIELTGLNPARTSELAIIHRQMAIFPQQVTRFGWTSQDTNISGQLEISRRAPRLSATNVQLTSVEAQSIVTRIESQLLVEGGGLRELTVSLPESAGRNLRFELIPFQPRPLFVDQAIVAEQQLVRPLPLIMQQQAGTAEEGLIPWTIKLDRYLLGQAVLKVTINQPRTTTAPPATTEGNTTEKWSIPMLLIPAADRVTGAIGIEATDDQLITAEAVDTAGISLERLDPIDFPPAHLTSSERLVAAFAYDRPGWKSVIAEQKLKRIPVPTAVIHSLALASNLGPEDVELVQAEATLSAVGVQSLLVQLPPNRTLLAASVNGTPVTVHKTSTALSIPLPPVSPPDAQRTVRLMYAPDGSGPKVITPSTDGVTLSDQPPAFSVATGTGPNELIPVLQTTWTIHHVKGLAPSSVHGDFQPTAPIVSHGVVHRFMSLFRLPSTSEGLFRGMLVLGVTVALLLLSTIWKRSKLLFSLASVLLLLAGLSVLGTSIVKRAMTPFAAELAGTQASWNDQSDFDRKDAEHDLREGMKSLEDAPAQTDGSGATELFSFRRNSGGAVPPGMMGGMGGGMGGIGGGMGIESEEKASAQPASDKEMPKPENASVDRAPVAASPASPGEPQITKPQAAPPQAEIAQQSAVPSDQELNLLKNEASMESPSNPAKPAIQFAPGKPAGTALLSLTFGLVPPAESKSSTFVTTADMDPAAPQELRVTMIDDQSRCLWTMAVATLVTLIGWWKRNSDLSSRVSFLVLTIILPLCARGLVQLTWMSFLDGIWIGGIVSLLLWLMRGVLRAVCRVLCKCCRGPQSTCATAVLLGLMISGLTGTASADEPQAVKPAPPLTIAPPVEPAPESVFIPYTDKDNPASSGPKVFVPGALFQKLWTAANPDLTTQTAPLSAHVVSAEFDIDLRKITAGPETSKGRTTGSVPVTGRLVLYNHSTGAVRLALPLNNVSLQSAQLDGAAAQLDVDPSRSVMSVTLPKPGPAVLQLQITIPVEQTGPAGVFVWENQPLAAGILKLTLPESDSALELRNSGTRLTLPSDKAVPVVISIDRGGRKELAWQPVSVRSGEDSPVQSQLRTVARFESTGLQLVSDVQLKVRQNSMTELRFQVPEGLRLKQITGRDVGGWKLEGEAPAQSLVVYFNRSIPDQTSLRIEAFQPLTPQDDETALSLRVIEPLDTIRVSGHLGLLVDESLSVRATGMTGLVQDDVSRFPAETNETDKQAPVPVQLAYRVTASSPVLELMLQRRKMETRASIAQRVVLSPRRQLNTTRIEARMTGAPRNTLSILLPEGVLLQDVTGEQVADYSLSEAADKRKLLTVELKQPQTGSVSLDLSTVTNRRVEDTSASLSIPQLLDVTKVDSELVIVVDNQYLATTSSIGQWTAIDPQSVTSQMLRAGEYGLSQFAFKTQASTPGQVALDLKLRTPELSGESLSLIAVSDSSVDYGLTLRWKISHAATSSLQFTTPIWLKGRLELTGPNVRQISSADDGNKTRWTVTLNDPVYDAVLLSGTASLALSADGRIQAPEIQFEQTGTDSTLLASQKQYAIVVNLSRKSLSVEDPSTVEVIPRSALPLVLPDPLVRQAMNIVQIPAGKLATWVAHRPESTGAVQATITSARLESHVEVDGSWRTRAIYTLRNRGQQYLPVDLSGMGSPRLLSIMVKGRPSRSLQTKIGETSIHLIPLPPSSAADLSYDVELVLSGRLPKPMPTGAAIVSTTFELPSPRIVSPAQSATFGIPVAQTVWMVRLPDGIKAVLDETGNVTPHQTDEWELLNGSQLLDRMEADMQEMSRILADQASSTTRKLQALNNLKSLSGSQLKNQTWNYEGSSLSSSAARLSELNYQRQSTLTLQLNEKIRDNAGLLGAKSNESEQIAVPQLSTFDVVGEQQGRALILQNNGLILNSNTFVPTPRFGDEEQFKARKSSDSKDGQSSERGRAMLRQRLEQQSVDNYARPADPFGASKGTPEAAKADANALFNQATSGQLPAGSDGLQVGQNAAVQLGIPSATPGQPGSAEWSTRTGLSLPVTLPPVDENSLAFSKVGGDPKLVLVAKSEESVTAAWSLGYVIAALLAGFWLMHAADHPDRFRWTGTVLMAVLGAVVFLLLPCGGRWLAFGLFAVATAVACLMRKPAT